MKLSLLRRTPALLGVTLKPTVKKSCSNPIWPKCILEGKLSYEDTTRGKLLAISDALDSWGIVLSGGKLPDGFGTVMLQIEEFVGCESHPPGKMIALSEELLLKLKVEEKQ